MTASGFDADYARTHFPALGDGWALFDNAGGSVAPRQLIDRVRAYMENYQVQLGASYPKSRAAAEGVRDGHTAAGELIGAPAGTAVLGSSTTMNLQVLSRAIQNWFKPGDEVIVTNLDHESNIGPWRKYEAAGIVIREWCVDRETSLLRGEDLEALISQRTRLLCFTQTSNIVGAIHDVKAITARAHAAGALVVVDGVAYAPHRQVDVVDLDVDFYVVSLYKTFGPHLGLLYGKREHLLRAQGQTHYFIPEDDIPYKLQPGNVSFELAAALPGILDYLDALARHHGDDAATRPARLRALFDRIADHEATLAERLLAYLRQRDDLHVLGPVSANRNARVATIAFTCDGHRASEIPPLLERHQVAVRYGNFYAYRGARDMALLARDGVVRASMAHYNTIAEVDRLIEALDREVK